MKPETQMINVVVQPDQLTHLIKHLVKLSKGELREVNIDMPDQATTVKILKALV